MPESKMIYINSLLSHKPVIPANAGIQCFISIKIKIFLDTGIRRYGGHVYCNLSGSSDACSKR